MREKWKKKRRGLIGWLIDLEGSGSLFPSSVECLLSVDGEGPVED